MTHSPREFARADFSCRVISGEAAPALSVRYDLSKAGSFLSCCQNFLPNLHGDIERRPGTLFIGGLDGPAVLLPFQFNTEPEHNYVLIFQEKKIRVARADGIVSGAVMDSPYSVDEAYEISAAQAADVIYLAHKKHPLAKIMRSGAGPDYEWKYAVVAINQSLAAPGEPEAWFVRDNWQDQADASYPLRYVVCAVDENGQESLPSTIAECQGKFPTDWVAGNHVDLRWNAVPGAVEYNVYRESAGYFGLIGVADAKNLDGGKIQGLEVEGFGKTGLSHYAAIRNRRIVIGNGYEEDVDVTDKTIRLEKTQSGQAFEFDGKMIVRLETRTHTTEWRVDSVHYGTDQTEDPQDPIVDYDKKETRESQYSWALINFPDKEQRVFSSWATGPSNKAGEPEGMFGQYKVKPYYEGGGQYLFQDQNYEADTSRTPKEDWNPFEGGNNPAVAAFHQQRLCLGNTRDNPASFFMSRTGDYENFRKSRPLQDDDPVEYMLASGSVDEIKWMASFGDLLIGTSGAEYQASSGGAAITPSDVRISAQSYWGSSALAPLIIGQSVMHCQRSGGHVRDLYYNWESDGYAGNDLSLLSPQLVEGRRVRQWCFQQSPGSNVWMAREDGVLLCLTYMKEQNVFGWSRHVTEGRVLSVCALCGEREERVMLVTERVIGGRKRWFLERMDERMGAAGAAEDAVFLDCAVVNEREEACKEAGGLGHLEGAEIWAVCDGTAVGGLKVKDGRASLPFVAKKVTAGLNYKSLLCPMPVETDTRNGSTLGKRRAYGKCVLRLFRSVGGSWAAAGPGSLYDQSEHERAEFFDLPYVPAEWGRPVEPFSGDIEITGMTGMTADASLWIRQDKPLPFRLCALMADIDFGEK